jgi:hypothetical protein
MANAVDVSPPYMIASAIRKVSKTPGLRIKPGSEVLWALFNAPEHSLPRAALAEKHQVDLHFGWFCKRVAEELGAGSPDTLALVDVSTGPDGAQTLTLKPAVAAAMAEFGKAGQQFGT